MQLREIFDSTHLIRLHLSACRSLYTPSRSLQSNEVFLFLVYRPNCTNMTDTPPALFLCRQSDMNLRAVLIDWVFDMMDQFNFLTEAAYLAIHLIDRVTAVTPIPRDYLALLSHTCILIATKLTDCAVLTLTDLSMMSCGKFTVQEIAQAELFVMECLDFNIALTTPVQLIRTLCAALQVEKRDQHLAEYILLQLALQVSTVASDQVTFGLAALNAALAPPRSFELSPRLSGVVSEQMYDPKCAALAYEVWAASSYNGPLFKKYESRGLLAIYNRFRQHIFSGVARLAPEDVNEYRVVTGTGFPLPLYQRPFHHHRTLDFCPRNAGKNHILPPNAPAMDGTLPPPLPAAAAAGFTGRKRAFVETQSGADVSHDRQSRRNARGHRHPFHVEPSSARGVDMAPSSFKVRQSHHRSSSWSFQPPRSSSEQFGIPAPQIDSSSNRLSSPLDLLPTADSSYINSLSLSPLALGRSVWRSSLFCLPSTSIVLSPLPSLPAPSSPSTDGYPHHLEVLRIPCRCPNPLLRPPAAKFQEVAVRTAATVQTFSPHALDQLIRMEP